MSSHAPDRRSAFSSGLIDSVDQMRIIMKKRGLHSIGEIANDRLETIEDGVEACPEAADWEVAAEHRSIDAEAFDSMQCSATSRKLSAVGDGS